MRVLVVEDGERLAASLRRGLTAEGFLVDVEHDGIDGLAAALSGRYDAIVLDIMLPRKNGYDVCRDLRTNGIWSPIIMLTAKDGEHDLADALELGADDYLTKPFSYVVLVARLRALVRRGAPQRPARLRVDDLELDPAAKTVRRGSTPITVTPREFSVLEHLMRHPGEVVSKLDILQNVWDIHYEGDENVVEIYIGYLRKKIDRPFDRSSIHTVRGFGYVLREETERA